MGEIYFEEQVPTIHAVCTGNVRNMRLLPEYFSFGPIIGDFFTHLVALTSSLSCRFIQFLEDLVDRDVDKCLQDAAVPFSGRHVKSFSSNYETKFEECTIPSNLFGSSTNFQVHKRISTFPKGNSSVNMSSTIVETKHRLWSIHSIFHGLMLPLFGFRLAWKVAFACFEFSSNHVSHIQMRVQSFISRVHRTLHGSSDDIGWLQQTPGVAPVQDGTTRFMELLDQIRNGEHTLPDSLVYLLIPGLFSNYSPLYFMSTKRFFSKMGLTCHIAKIHSEASVERNAWELKQYIDELYWGSGKRVLLLGHSKGGVDAAAALSLYWSVLKDKVAGLALVQSPYGGSPIASDILREGQIADKEARRIMEFLICKLIKGDIRALEDLTYEKRKEFVTKHKLPEQVPLVSFHSEASIAPGVLATMSHIAHAELPWLPLPSFGHEEMDSCQAGRKLPVIIPLAAAMAVCALHLQLRYGEKSDGLVTCRDAEVPGSVVVRPDQKLDHAWMVYSSRKKETNEPDASEMCEALLTLLVEIGNMKQKNIQGDGKCWRT